MLIFNANQLNSLQEIFVTVLILHPTLILLAFRAYLLEPPPQDYISKGKTIEKSQNSNEVKNCCTRSRIRIALIIFIFNLINSFILKTTRVPLFNVLPFAL